MQPSQTAYVILGMLSVHPNQSGYHIRKTIECTVNYFWSESYGQIYPTLKRLAAEGLIAACPSTSPGARQRREYSITAAGQACLQEWLAQPYRDHPPRDEFLLKLFFGGEVQPSVAIGHIRDFREKNRRLLAALLELETLAHKHNAQHPQFPFWMLTLSFGLSQIRSALEWSESALAMLSTRSD
jgi:DNA-binding PadR family transcriptional regulator